MDKTKLTLVVPCFNEDNNILKFYEAIKSAFNEVKYKYDVIFIDDGSNDFTLNKLKQLLNQENENISVISFSRNFGKEAAIYAGLKQSKGDLVTIIDADLQQRPELVVQMVEKLEENPEYDCIAAYQEERSEAKLVSVFKGMFYKIINKVCEIDFYPGASDFRTMRRPMVDAIVEMAEYYRFSKGIFSWVGFNTHFMPYTAEERNAGESKWSIKALFLYAIEGIISFTTFPLKIAIYLGATTSAVAILYMIIVIIQKLFFSIEIPGYPTIIVLVLLLGGIQLFIQGIIGEYLARVYIQGKNRPIYIQKEFLERKRSIDADIQ